MTLLCNEVLEVLDTLESSLSQCRDIENVAELLYTCLREARELKHISVKETATRMTKQQVVHIHRLMNDVDKLVDAWPSAKPY
jgi:hypothetical protein